MKNKEKQVKCSVCRKPIKIDDFGGIDKEGFYHRNCIVEKIKNEDEIIGYIEMKNPVEKEIEFLNESNKIEGVYDSDSLQQAVFAWEYLKEQNELNISIILKTHKILMLHKKLPPNQKGYFRREQVWVGGQMGINWLKIQEAIHEWCLDAMTSIIAPGKNGSNIRLDHIRFEEIHPFIDGNGRLGRLLMLWERTMAGLPVKIIYAKNRNKYYKWFK